MRIAVMLVAALAVAGCAQKQEKRTEAPPVVTGVEVAEVRQETLPEELEVVGTVKAREVAVLAARVAGTVTAVHVRQGDRVARGKVVAQFESTESAAGAAGAAAAVEEARRGVDEAAARKRLADVTCDRYEKLFVEQAVSRQELDGRRTEKEVAAQALAAAEQRLLQARESLRSAGAVAGYTRVVSPIAGIVTVRSVDPGATIFPGSPVATVEGDGGYRLELAVPESLAGKVRPGQVVPVSLDGVAGVSSARVAEVVPSVDPLTRTFIAKADISGKGLRSGMFGTGRFATGSATAVMVPRTALFQRGALTAAWVVAGDKARLRLVKAGRTLGEKVEILAGLSPGEKVVVSGGERVVEGATVKGR